MTWSGLVSKTDLEQESRSGPSPEALLSWPCFPIACVHHTKGEKSQPANKYILIRVTTKAISVVRILSFIPSILYLDFNK